MFSNLPAPERLLARFLTVLLVLVVATVLLSEAPSPEGSLGAIHEVALAVATLGAGLVWLLSLPFAVFELVVLQMALPFIADYYVFLAAAGGMLWTTHITLTRARTSAVPKLNKLVDGAGFVFLVLMTLTHIIDAPRIFSGIDTHAEVLYFTVAIALMLLPAGIGLVHGFVAFRDSPNAVTWLSLGSLSACLLFPMGTMVGHATNLPNSELVLLSTLGHLMASLVSLYMAYLYLDSRKEEAVRRLTPYEAPGATSEVTPEVAPVV